MKRKFRKLIVIAAVGLSVFAWSLHGNQALGQAANTLRPSQPTPDRSQPVNTLKGTAGSPAVKPQAVRPAAWRTMKPQTEKLERDRAAALRLVAEMQRLLEDGNFANSRNKMKLSRTLKGLADELKKTGNTVSELRRTNKLQAKDQVRGRQVAASLEVHQTNYSRMDTDLKAQITRLESDMEQVRNKRQEYQTMFENFDQKANQLFNILSTVMKAIKEMRSSVIRNML